MLHLTCVDHVMDIKQTIWQFLVVRKKSDIILRDSTHRISRKHFYNGVLCILILLLYYYTTITTLYIYIYTLLLQLYIITHER